MNPRAAVASIVAGAVVLVAFMAGSSPAADLGPDPRALDLVASAHPSSARTTVRDTAYTAAGVHRAYVEADTAALTSTTCDGCTGESTALHVLYVPRARRARLDNVANAWAQECQGCTGTALSVQVVVLGGRPTTVPNNRALSLTAACDGCRTSALAFQVVLVGDPASPLSAAELAELRAWVDGQAAVLRASVGGPLPEPTPATATPTPSPTPSLTPSLTPEPTTKPLPSPSPTRPTSQARPSTRDAQRARRNPTSALRELRDLLTDALDADVVAADVEVSR